MTEELGYGMNNRKIFKLPNVAEVPANHDAIRSRLFFWLMTRHSFATAGASLEKEGNGMNEKKDYEELTCFWSLK
jgi:hypothetical protein